MKKIILLTLWASLLWPAQMTAQTAVQDEAPQADSTVLMVPLRQLVTERLDALVDDSLMERSQLGLMVWDLTDDTLLYARGEHQLLRPASTMKVLTAIAALDCLGPDYRYTTTLYHKGTISQGRLQGDLVCVGGMDPMFDRKDMQAFAQALKKKGVKSLGCRLIIDTSMKDGDKWGEGWCWDDKNPTLSPLLYEGKTDFAGQLLRELRSVGIGTGSVSAIIGNCPKDAQPLCTRSHTIDEVLRQMMKESDNLYAEATYYQIAARVGRRPATAKDAQKVEHELLTKVGLDADHYRLADGSGLSLYNYLTAEAQVMLLRYAWQQPDIYSHLLASLPIAGVDGTLEKRLVDTAAQGNVRAKTGTVSGISALAGYCTAPNGHRLCFSIINQGVRRSAEGREFQNRVCLALCQP